MEFDGLIFFTRRVKSLFFWSHYHNGFVSEAFLTIIIAPACSFRALCKKSWDRTWEGKRFKIMPMDLAIAICWRKIYFMLHTLKNSKKLLAFQQAKMQQTAAFLPTRFHRVMVSKLTFKHEGSEFESRSSQVFLIFFSRNDYFSFVPRIILR